MHLIESVDYQPMPKHAEEEVGAKRVEDLKEFLGKLGMKGFIRYMLYSH